MSVKILKAILLLVGAIPAVLGGIWALMKSEEHPECRNVCGVLAFCILLLCGAYWVWISSL